MNKEYMHNELLNIQKFNLMCEVNELAKNNLPSVLVEDFEIKAMQNAIHKGENIRRFFKICFELNYIVEFAFGFNLGKNSTYVYIYPDVVINTDILTTNVDNRIKRIVIDNINLYDMSQSN